MKKYDILKTQLNNTISDAKKDVANLNKIADEAKRISETARDAHIIISDIDKQFEEKTKLTNSDIILLFFAVAFHVVRQVLQPKLDFKTDHSTSDEKYEEKERKILGEKTPKKEMENKKHRWYKPSLEEVCSNPIPFDTQFGGGKDNFDIFSLPKEATDIFKSKSPKGMRHRTATLGHDPILGWIFGTSNIATATLTTWDLKSFHVKYAPNSAGILVPKITNNARLDLIFEHMKKKLLDKNVSKDNGKIIIGVSLVREYFHLKSDQHTFASLPIPLTSLISPKFAEHLAAFGIDMSLIGNITTVGKQASLAIVINALIAMLHGLINCDNKENPNFNLIQVRTSNILKWSNTIASASNIIWASILGFIAKDPKVAIKNLDIGGILVTLYQIVSDIKFKEQIKKEFLEKEFYNRVYGEEYNF